mgnify:CR=1 FL=1
MSPQIQGRLAKGPGPESADTEPMNHAPTILLTGATGYIASHNWLALQAAGHAVLGLDNFCNSSPEVLARLQRLGGRPTAFERGDVCDEAVLDALFTRHRIAALVHFAALKSVGESGSQQFQKLRRIDADLADRP